MIRFGMALLLACACASAAPAAAPAAPATQATPTAAPAPSAAPLAPDPAPGVDGDVTVAAMNGMQILVKRVPGAELVAMQLYIRGGVRNWDRAHAGVEDLALSVSTSGGTRKLDKDAFARRLAALGSSLDASAGNDFSALSAKSLKAHFGETFALLADAFLEPALPAAEIELQRQRQLSQLKHEQEYPDSRLDFLVHQTLFHDHPYGRRAIGTLETVAKLSAADLSAHLAKLRETSRLLLVVVGDLEAAEVVAGARRALGHLPRGTYQETQLPSVKLDRAALVVVEKKLPTNYIQGVFLAPGWRDPDFATAMVAMEVLGLREFEEVRTKRNLSYAAGAFLRSNLAIARGTLYVTAVDPNATMEVMLAQARRLQSEPVPAPELAGDKAVFLTGYLMGSESTDGQAGLLARAQLLGGDWHLARTFPGRVRAVTAGDVQTFARKYIGRLQTVVLGDPARLNRTLFQSL